MFDRSPAVFVEWAKVSAPGSPLRQRFVELSDHHTDRFVETFRAAGLQGSEAVGAALMVIAVSNRFHYVRVVHGTPAPREAQIEALAVSLQRFLFPMTPVRLLAQGPRPADPARAWASPGFEDSLPPTLRPEVPADTVDALQPDLEIAAVHSRARITQQVLDGAAASFAAARFDATNVDEIVRIAGVSRATFYRHFADKLDTMVALAHDAGDALGPLFDEFVTVAPRRDADALRNWLGRFLAVQRHFAGVLRAWTEGIPDDPRVRLPAGQLLVVMRRTIDAAFGAPRPYPLHRYAARMVMAGVFEHFPSQCLGGRHELTDDQVIETQAQFIERVLLPPLR